MRESVSRVVSSTVGNHCSFLRGDRNGHHTRNVSPSIVKRFYRKPQNVSTVPTKHLIGWINEPKKAGFEGAAQSTAVNCRKPGYAVQISAVLVQFKEFRGNQRIQKLFVLPRPFLFLTTSQHNSNVRFFVTSTSFYVQIIYPKPE